MLINVGTQANKEVSSLIKDSGSFFAGDEWQQHLQQSFRVQSLYFHTPERDDGMVVQVFQRGPFRVGYLNFPVGGTFRQLEPNEEIVEALTGYLRQYSVHRLRIRKSAFRDSNRLKGEPIMEPETAVTNVQQYNSRTNKKVRRDLSRSSRFGVTVSENPIILGSYLFNTYAETVKRYAGELRYPQEYFYNLVRLSSFRQNIRIFLAEKDQQPVGFLVLIIEGGTAYYLHGGVSATAKKYGVSDVLVDHALSISREYGVCLFNLMVSPPTQPSLVKFKEKWGGETRQHKTYDLPIGFFWHQTLSLIEKIYYQTTRYRKH